MSQPITIEDIYKLFEKTNEKFEQSRQEYDRRAAEAKAEYDRRAAEAKAEYDRRAAEAKAEADRWAVAMEIDILAVDETEVVLVECKSRLSKDDVNEFLEKLSRFKQAFPHYKNYQAYGAVAGIEIDEGVDRYAYKQGLFVIKPSGETVEIINDSGFEPKLW